MSAEGSTHYDVITSPAARRDLKHLKKTLPESQLRNIVEKIEALGSDPRPFGSEKLSAAENVFRIRVGDYRVIYAIRDEKAEIEIARIRDRKDVYRP